MSSVANVIEQRGWPGAHSFRAVLAGLAFFLAALCVPTTSVAKTGAAVAASSLTSQIYYGTLANKQFVNNGGDRARGVGNNPFGNYAGVTLNIPVNSDELIGGPFPGDVGAYQLNLFSDSSHRTPVGSAIFICQYSFDQNSICDVALDLPGGSITGKGGVNFDDAKFSLAVTGGTGSFRAVKGSILATAAGAATQAQPVRRSIPLLQNLTLDVTARPASSAAGSTWQRVVITESPGNETFINNNDDEARGDVNNPWGGINDQAAEQIDEHVNGPFPGDEAFFTFHIAAQAGKAGLGLFLCQYYFSKNGFCHATFNFGGGTLVAEGTFNFNAKTFTLAVTGAYGRFSDDIGEVVAAAASGHGQQLTFELRRV